MKWLPIDEYYDSYSLILDFKLSPDEERKLIEYQLKDIDFEISEETVKDFAIITNKLAGFIRKNCQDEIKEFIDSARSSGIAMGGIPPDILLAKYTAQHLLIAAAKFVAGIAIPVIIEWLLDQKVKKKEKEDTKLIGIIEKVLEKTRNDKEITKIIVTKIEKYSIEVEKTDEDHKS